MSPKISILIPAYNVEKYIARCLDTIVGQTFGDIEIVIVDDASTDGTLGIIEDYASRDSRIKVIRHPENMGLVWVRNTGIDASTGDYIMFADSDDTMDLTICEKLYNKAVEEDADLVISGYNRVSPGRVRPVPFRLNYGSSVYGVTKALIEDEVWPSLWGKLFRADLLKDHPIPKIKNSNMREDVLIFNSILPYIKKAVSIDECLYDYFCNPESITTVKDDRKYVEGIMRESSILLKSSKIDDGLFQDAESRAIKQMYSALYQCGDRRLIVELARSYGLDYLLSFRSLRKRLSLRKTIVRWLAYRFDLASWYIRR